MRDVSGRLRQRLCFTIVNLCFLIGCAPVEFEAASSKAISQPSNVPSTENGTPGIDETSLITDFEVFSCPQNSSQDCTIICHVSPNKPKTVILPVSSLSGHGLHEDGSMDYAGECVD